MDLEKLIILAEGGDLSAQLNLSDIYFIGDGVPTDEKEAGKWCRRAAHQGDSGSQYLLGLMFQYGEGGVSTNFCEAVKWFQKAADQGDSRAKDKLIYLRSKGLIPL